jgi:hypothetical protein
LTPINDPQCICTLKPFLQSEKILHSTHLIIFWISFWQAQIGVVHSELWPGDATDARDLRYSGVGCSEKGTALWNDKKLSSIESMI